MATCKLCESSVPKLVRCHVYPAAMTREIAGGVPLVALHNTGHTSITRDGLFDREIVCGACEDRFGVSDDYAIDFRRGVLNLSIPFRLQYHTTRLPTFRSDPERLHLFAMQTLLRSCLSERSEHSGVNDPLIEAEVKSVLLGQRSSLSSGRQVAYVFARDDLGSYLATPLLREVPGHPLYELKMPHMVIWIAASESGLPRELSALALVPGDEVTVWRRKRPLDIELDNFRDLYTQQFARVDRIFGSFKRRRGPA